MHTEFNSTVSSSKKPKVNSHYSVEISSFQWFSVESSLLSAEGGQWDSAMLGSLRSFCIKWIIILTSTSAWHANTSNMQAGFGNNLDLPHWSWLSPVVQLLLNTQSCGRETSKHTPEGEWRHRKTVGKMSSLSFSLFPSWDSDQTD